MNQDQINQQLHILQEGIRIDAPLVADFFATDTPLGEYAAQIQNYSAHPLHQQRQTAFKHTVRTELEKVFSAQEIDAANIDWDTDWKINIVDHHGILNHPILMSTNIIAQMHQLPSTDPRGVVVLSDSGVPMNNFFHKRGMRFAGHQLNLVPNRLRHAVAAAAPLKESFPLVDAAERIGITDSKQLDFLRAMQERIESISLGHGFTQYKEQISRLNYALWPELFAPDIRDEIPQLFYVTNEDVAHRLLRNYLKDPSNLFYRILCDKETRDVVLNAFEGVTGCWNRETNIGSVFFWGVDEKHRAVRLSIQGGILFDASGKTDIRVELNADSILEALEQGRIYPTMFLVYGIANFYCGIRPLVGYGSMNYQTAMKASWRKALEQIQPEDIEALDTIDTRGFIGGPKVTFAWNEQDGFINSFALDIIARGGLTRDYLEHLRAMPFSAVLQPALIDIYDSYVRPEHKQEITVSSNDLMGDPFEWVRKV